MKKVLKICLGIVVVLFILTSTVAAYIYYCLPNVHPASETTIERTPQRIERGKYLVNSVAACMACHADRNFDYFAGPVDSSSFGAGGEMYSRKMNFPGEVYSRNITPHALGNWTDGELLRVLTTGVRKDGTALFPIMPYKRYAKMEREDLYSIIAYLRSLKPVSKEVPERELDFPLNFMVNTMPEDVEGETKVDSTNPVAYGGYLVNAASCIECHSQAEKGEIIPGTEFGGGREFNMRKGGKAYSANITSDKETGIGSWSEEIFVRRFKMYQDSSYRIPTVTPGEFNTPMPWFTYSTLSEKDLAAIYAYLQTVKPIKNKKKAFIPGTAKIKNMPGL